MEKQGQNEGFRVLDDFVCEAIPASEVAVSTSRGRGVNAGMEVVAELVVEASQAPLTEERLAELRAMSSGQLVALIRSSGSKLSGQELLAIHDIAAERWTKGDTPIAEDAIELSREAMLVAVNRTISQ